MSRLAAPLADFAFRSEYSVHRRHRAEIAAFVQQIRVNAGWRLVHEAFVMQDAQDRGAFGAAERPRLRCPLCSPASGSWALAMVPIVGRSGPAQRRTR